MNLRATAARLWHDLAFRRSAKWPDIVEFRDITLDAMPPKSSKGNLVLFADPPSPLLGHFRYGSAESDLKILPFDRTDDAPAVVEEPVIYGGPAFRQFGHALAESIHRLWPRFARKELSGAKIAFVPVRNTKIVPYMIEALNLHGISRAEVLRVDRPMRFTQLFVAPQARQMCGPTLIPAYQKMLDSMLVTQVGPAGGGRRVYFSRAQHGHTGSFYGESLVERVLEDAGFEVIYPEHLTLTELVRTLRSTSLAVFAEGSAIHALELCGSATPAVFIISRRGASVPRFAPLLSAICRKWMISDHLVLNIGMAIDFKKHSGLVDLERVLHDLWEFSGLAPEFAIDARSRALAIADDLERHIADPRVERTSDHDRRAQEIREIVAAALA